MLKEVKKMINEDYVNSEVTKIKDGDLDVVMENNKQINDKISSSGALQKYTELGKIMYGMLNDYRKGLYHHVPWFTVAAIGFALLYVLNPLDIIPDFIPGVGYVDDFAVFTIVLRFVQTDLHTYLDWKIARAKGEDPDEE